MSKPWSLPTIVSDAFGFDRAMACFLGEKNGGTTSQRLGTMQAQGRPFGCVLCRVLDVLVERGHCVRAVTIGDGPTTGGAQIRSGLVLLVVALVCIAPWAAMGWWIR